MNEQKAKVLLERYNSGLLSPAEKQQLELWYLEQARKSKLKLNEQDLLDSIQQLSGRLPLVQPRTRRLWPRFAAAASIVLALGTAVYFYAGRNKDQFTSEVFANDIAPGRNGATLTLASGKKILINDALAGNIASEAGVRISKTKDGQIVYEIVDGGSTTNAYNTLSTTRGEQTQVRLPDGTLVFLNAESSLKYPTSFARLARREVVLSGEGYFEVAKDKSHPFTVESDGQKIEVLGTHFNVHAYKGEDELKTTLIEGSVKVMGALSGSSKILKPGDQSRLLGNSIEVKQVNVSDMVAWKDGIFRYDGATLEEIMRDVARWYNVKVTFQNESVKKEQFFLTTNRYDKVSGMLKLLQGMKVATFKIKGNEIIIDKL